MKIEDFYRYVSPELPGCPEETMRQAIVLAARDFCARTHAWTEVLEPIVLADGVSEYDYEAPFGASALTAIGVWLNGNELRSASLDQLDFLLPGWQTATGSEPRYYNAAFNTSSIRVFPTPVSPTGSIVMRLAFEPKMASTSLPDVLLEDNNEAIAAGAKARLMVQPNKQWSNAPLGAFYGKAFEDAAINERINVLHDRVPGVTRVRPRRFGA